MSEDKDYSKPFSNPRWTQPPAVKVIGHEKSTPKEEEENKKIVEDLKKYYGISNSSTAFSEDRN